MSTTTSTFPDRLTGCLLGMAIGDALGVPFAYRAHPESVDQDAALAYRARVADDGSVEVPRGQFSLNTELALCLLETLVTSDGYIDPELATMRFHNALLQPQTYLVDPEESAAIDTAVESESFQGGLARGSVEYAGPAIRAIPIALAHSLSDLNIALLTREVMRSVLMTHCDPAIVNGSLAVAYAIRLVLRQELPIEMLAGEVVSLIDEDEVARKLRNGFPNAEPIDVAGVVSAGTHAFVEGGGDFEASISAALRTGGATHLTGALAGALAGAYKGATAIPQHLVDGLEGRAYLLMASPALLRTAQMRAGLFFQLHIR